MAYQLKQTPATIEAMSIEHVLGLIAYDQFEPMANEYAMHGSLCSLIAQLAGNKNIKPEDFIPVVKEQEAKTVATDEFIRSILGGMNDPMQRNNQS